MPELAIPYRVETALERGIEGRGLAREDALRLLEEGPLEALLTTAAAVRDRSKGDSVSYSRKVFIPLTHLCRDYCGYCTFRADPQAGVQPYMLPDEVLAVAERVPRARDPNCRRRSQTRSPSSAAPVVPRACDG